MQTEALRNLRTMRQVKSSLEVAKQQKVRATNLLAGKDAMADLPEPRFDRSLEHTLAREKLRATAFEASVEKSRRRLLKLRESLATVIRRNHALMDLRANSQKARWGKGMPEQPPSPKSQSKFREVEFRY